MRSASIIQCDDFSINDCAFGKLDKSFNEIRILAIERFAATGVQADFVAGFDGDSAVAVECDLLWGAEIYVALGADRS